MKNDEIAALFEDMKASFKEFLEAQSRQYPKMLHNHEVKYEEKFAQIPAMFTHMANSHPNNECGSSGIPTPRQTYYHATSDRDGDLNRILKNHHSGSYYELECISSSLTNAFWRFIIR
ncbi:hypothetical protein CsatA_024416 [Cannabis sativa]